MRIRERFQQLESKTILNIMEIYKRDMDIFGYSFDIETLTAGGWN